MLWVDSDRVKRRTMAMKRFIALPDLDRYRKGYPGEDLNDRSQNLNVRFYMNEIQSFPEGGYSCFTNEN